MWLTVAHESRVVWERRLYIILHLDVIPPGNSIKAKFSTCVFRYMAEWYNSSPRIKSLLIITFYRSIVPCGLSAGNMFQLSMTTYSTVSIGRKLQIDFVARQNCFSSACIRFKVVRMGMSYFTAFLSFKEWLPSIRLMVTRIHLRLIDLVVNKLQYRNLPECFLCNLNLRPIDHRSRALVEPCDTL